MGLLGGNDDEEPETPDDVGEAEPEEGLDLGEDPAETGEPSPIEDDAIEDADLDDAEGDGGAPEAAQNAAQESDIDVEEALKELSARMSVLSSNLEGVQDSRGELEDKLGTVEERMSRLGSLAEAVSSEYNPFISENAPDEPSWTPEPEAKEDRGEAPASEPSSGDEDHTAHDEAPDEPDPTQGPDGPGGPEQSDAGETDPEADETAAPPTDETAGTPEEAPTPEPDPEPEPESVPRTDPDRLGSADPDPDPSESLMPDPSGRDRDRGSDGSARHPGDDQFEDNLLMLEWVGMMLDRVGRAGLMDLLDYYQNLGWLDTDLKDRATRIAVGVDAPDRVGDSDWRGDVDLHRRSLVAIQRLRGHEIPAARVDEVQLDLRRLFEE